MQIYLNQACVEACACVKMKNLSSEQLILGGGGLSTLALVVSMKNNQWCFPIGHSPNAGAERNHPTPFPTVSSFPVFC